MLSFIPTRLFAIYYIASCTVALGSCKFNENMQGKGRDDVQGVWEEGTVAYQNERLQYSKHQFRFSCDSVYVTIKTFANVNTYPDSCFNNGRWTEYAKGVYETKKDTLLITATFTKPDFKQKISGCYRTGQYLPAFVIKKSTTDTLYLEGLQEHLPFYLILKERTPCIQKPLN
ncbi:fumarate hydratase [Daejeonella sp.]|uniref:fumarate hydratase n=1 Tax=Daejeonella sp. TaxID=2805397 RepID=UPI0030BC20C1